MFASRAGDGTEYLRAAGGSGRDEAGRACAQFVDGHCEADAAPSGLSARVQ